MTKGRYSPYSSGWVAIAAGVAGLLGIGFIVLFFTIGQPFGTLADIGSALLASLSGLLTLALLPHSRTRSPFLSLAALVLALACAVIATSGSALVISGRTGWFLAATYTVTGFTVIGLWLEGLNAFAQQDSAWPRNLVIAGIIIGIIMALGLAAVPGIVSGVDAQSLAPWHVSYVGIGLGSLGWFVLYPIWCLRLGGMSLRKLGSVAQAR